MFQKVQPEAVPSVTFVTADGIVANGYVAAGSVTVWVEVSAYVSVTVPAPVQRYARDRAAVTGVPGVIETAPTNAALFVSFVVSVPANFENTPFNTAITDALPEPA